MTYSGLLGNSCDTHLNASAAKCVDCYSISERTVFISDRAIAIGVRNRAVPRRKDVIVFMEQSIAMRWSTDVDVWTSRGARNGRAKSQIRNSVSLEKIQQSLAFGAVRMKRNIHRVVVVQAPAIVNRALTEDGDGQFAFECV